MTQQSDIALYYHDADGYLSRRQIFQAGATSKAPLADADVPAGKVQRWSGTDWELVNAPASVATVDFSTLAQSLAYDATSGNLTSVTAGPDSSGNYYKQTLSYTNGKLTGVSTWVKQ